MAVFSGLSDRINHVFSKLKSKGSLTELEIKQAMREVRVALLEADVNITVAKDFIKNVTEKAVGEEILKGLNPAQQVIKIVNEELTALMGSTQSKLVVSSKLPTIIMMCGLQGAGKTTMCGKLAMCNVLRQLGIKYTLTENFCVHPLTEEFSKDLNTFASIWRRNWHQRPATYCCWWCNICTSFACWCGFWPCF